MLVNLVYKCSGWCLCGHTYAHPCINTYLCTHTHWFFMESFFLKLTLFLNWNCVVVADPSDFYLTIHCTKITHYGLLSTSEETYQGSFPAGSHGKEFACNAGDLGLIPGSGRCPGGGHGNPLQYFCLQNPMDRGAWWATVHGVTNSWTQLSN